MSDLIFLLVAFAFVAVTAALFELSWRTGHIKQWLARKFLHITAISTCALVPLVVDELSYLKITVIISEILLLLLVGKFNLFIEKSGRKSWGIALFPIPYIFLLYLFEDDRVFIAIPMFILAFADAVACIIGTLYAKKKFELTGDLKSPIGSFAFFTTALIIIIGFKIYWLSHSLGTSLLLESISLAFILTLLEMLGSNGSDNLLIPTFAALFLSAEQMVPSLSISTELLFLTLTLILYGINTKLNWLSLSGIATSIILGYAILRFSGWEYLVPIIWFLASGSILSKLNLKKNHAADVKSGRARDWLQVVSNGGLYGWVLIASTYFSDSEESLLLKSFAIVAVVTADTWSSEIGQRFSTKAFDLYSLRLQSGGISGGLSLVGSLGGLTGAISIALLALMIEPNYGINQLVFISSLGFLGMLFDSLLGAFLQKRYHDSDLNSYFDAEGDNRVLQGKLRILSNDNVNLLSPLIVFIF